MEQKFCQCCGMPMDSEELYGTEANGSKSADYCKYCYDKGAFTFNGTMDEMIEICIPPMVEANADMTADKARAMMREFFPMLKRWKKA
jgi:hypothetical protein